MILKFDFQRDEVSFSFFLKSPIRTILHRNCSRCYPHPGGASAFAGCRTAFWCWQTPDTATFAAGWADLRCSTWCTFRHRHWAEQVPPDDQRTSLPDSRSLQGSHPDGWWHRGLWHRTWQPMVFLPRSILR